MEGRSTTQPGCQEVSKAATCPATGPDTAMSCSASPRMEADKGTTPLAIGLGGDAMLLELGITTKHSCPSRHPQHLLYALFLRRGTHRDLWGWQQRGR